MYISHADYTKVFASDYLTALACDYRLSRDSYIFLKNLALSDIPQNPATDHELTSREYDFLSTILTLPVLVPTSEITVDVIRSQQTWAEFVDTIDEFFGRHVVGPAYYLANIRKLDRQSDIAIFYESLRLIGFDLQQDLFDVSGVRNNVRNYYAQFADYYKTNGTRDFIKFVVFLLKRNVNVTELWTRSYLSQDFFPMSATEQQAQATNMLTNAFHQHNFIPQHSFVVKNDFFTGNQPVSLYYTGFYRPEEPFANYFSVLKKFSHYYKTTHVDLDIDLTGMDKVLLTGPTEDLLKRMHDLIYEFAPINMVIRYMYFTMVTKVSNYYVKVTSVYNFLEYVYVGRKVATISHVEIQGPSTLLENSTGTWYLCLVMSDGTRLIREATSWSSNRTVLTFVGGVGSAGNVSEDTSVIITVVYNSWTSERTVTVIDRRVSNYAAGLTIVGPNVVSDNTTTQYHAVLTWSNGYAQILYPVGKDSTDLVFWQLWNRIKWSCDSFLHRINTTAQLTTGEMGDFQKFTNIKLTARFMGEDDTVIYAKHPVVVKNDNAQLRVDSIALWFTTAIIVGPLPPFAPQQLLPEVNHTGTTIGFYHMDLHQGDVRYLHTVATHNDLSTRGVVPIYTLHTNVATIVGNVLKVGHFEEEFLAYLEVAYQATSSDVILRVVVELHFLPLRLTLVSLEILGPDVVNEQQHTSYLARATWSFGLTKYVGAVWESDFYYIDQTTGVFFADHVFKDDTVRLRAIYSDNNSMLVAEKEIFVKRPLTVPDKAEILGVSTIKQGSDPHNYKVALYFSSGKTVIVTGMVWSLDEEEPALKVVAINRSGTPVLDAPDPDHPLGDSSLAIARMAQLTLPDRPHRATVTLRAVFKYDNVDYDVSKSIGLIPQVVPYNVLTIHGPDAVDEQSFTEYTAVIRNTAGETFTDIEPTWSMELYDPNNSPELPDVARLDRRGGLTAREVDAVVIVRITARYFHLQDSLLVSIIDRGYVDPNFVDCAFIRGPNYVCEDTACYSLMIYQNNDVTPTNSSATWYLDVDDEIAELDDNGCLTVWRANKEETQVRITALYTCPSLGTNNCEPCGFDKPYTLSRSRVVTVCARNLDPLYDRTDDCKDTLDNCLYARVVGPTTVDELTCHDYHFMLYFRDGTSVELFTDEWDVTSVAYASMSANSMCARDVTRDVTVKVCAFYRNYPICGDLYDCLDVLIKDRTVAGRHLLYIVISGPTIIPEKTCNTHYVLTAFYSDSSTSDITFHPTTHWSLVEDPLAYAEMQQEVLCAGDIDEDKWVTIFADYTEDGTVYTDTHRVKIIVKGLVSVEIVGPTVMDENTCENYVLKAFYTDSAFGVIVPSLDHPGNVNWSVIFNPQFAHLTKPNPALAQVCAEEVTRDETITLKACFDDSTLNVSMCDTHDVLIRNKIVYYPVYGIGPWFNTADTASIAPYVDEYVYTELTPITPGTFFIVQHSIVPNNDDPGQYAWLAYPKDFGTPAISSTLKRIDATIWQEIFSGGLEGATWGDNLQGTKLDPVEFTRVIDGNTSVWLLHRSDWGLPNDYNYKYILPNGFPNV